MELALQSEMYTPSVDEQGNYVDNVYLCRITKEGIRCPCGARKSKSYGTTAIFTVHTKTQTHQNWLGALNRNKANYYVENERLKETVATQRLIIARLEKDVTTKILTIDYITRQIEMTNSNDVAVTNLLVFD
jgi:hypothetical protein